MFDCSLSHPSGTCFFLIPRSISISSMDWDWLQVQFNHTHVSKDSRLGNPTLVWPSKILQGLYHCPSPHGVPTLSMIFSSRWFHLTYNVWAGVNKHKLKIVQIVNSMGWESGGANTSRGAALWMRPSIQNDLPALQLMEFARAMPTTPGSHWYQKHITTGQLLGQLSLSPSLSRAWEDP